jgi:transitional endoplasmic reticulum ATPase
MHLICTTNDPSGIDSGALRSGRIDEVVFLPLPNNKTKEAILRLFLQRLPHEEAIDLSAVVGHMINFTSSDIEKAVNAAANMALSMMIDNHVKNRSSAIIKINEQILMDVVANMSPSLTEETRARHEQIHRQYSTNMKTHRKRIGFNT